MVLGKARSIIFDYVKSGSKVAVAVSGGLDSMCLIDLILQCKKELDFEIFVVNIEHGIRGENSKHDSEFVRDFCLKNSLTFIHRSVDVLTRSAVSGHSIENEARNVRKEVFVELVNNGTADMVLTAHHQLDNAETVLMHSLRGGGLNALCGMKIFDRNKQLRPLLTTSKNELLLYAEKNGIEYVIDETNFQNEYTRNFLRNEVFPLLEKKYKGVADALCALSFDAVDALEIIKGTLNFSYISVKNENTVRLDLDAFDEQNGKKAPYYIFEALRKIGIFCDIERRHIKLIKDLRNGENGSRLDLKKDLKAFKEYDCIVFLRDSLENEKSQKQVPFKKGQIIFGKNEILIESIDEPINFSHKQKDTLYFDESKIPSSAVFRTRNDGDIFCPFNGGTKKLKEFLIDKKIPLRLRDELVILADGREVLAVCGVEISDRIKIEGDSKPTLLKILLK